MAKRAGVPIFVVPLPGGRVARVPLDVLEQYVDAAATAAHAGVAPEAASADAAVGVEVTAHDLRVDPRGGTSVWHTDYEFGLCSYTDEAGFPQYGQAWHCHPLGTEYAEVMR